MDFLCGTVKKDNKIYAGFRPEDIFRQFNIIPSTVVGFYIRSTSLRKVGLLNITIIKYNLITTGYIELLL